MPNWAHLDLTLDLNLLSNIEIYTAFFEPVIFMLNRISNSVAEMIPVVAPHALQRRKQIVTFVVATPMLAKGGSDNLVLSGTYWFT